MSKKFVGKVILSLMLAMSFTGCGTIESVMTEKMDEENIISLRVWGPTGDQALLNQLVEAFKEEYKDEATFDIVIEADEGDDKYTILGDVNQAPDVFTLLDDQLASYVAAGILEPVLYQDEVAAANLEGSIEAATINEEIYAYPLTADNGYFMYYNKDYFTDEDVQSLDRMLEVAKAHDKKISMDWTSGWYLYSFFGNTGLELGLNSDYVTNYCTWNQASGDISGAAVAEAMRKIATHDAFVSLGDNDLISGIEDGSIIAGINGIWNAVEVENAWKDGYAATKLPTYTVAGKQVQMSSYAGYKLLGVNSYSDHHEWAQKLAHFLSNEQSQIERFKQRGQGPSNINASKIEEISNSVALSALIKQSEFASLQRVGEFYWDAATKMGDMLYTGDLKGMNYQALMDSIVKQITSTRTTQK